MDKTPKKIKNMFNKIAKRYDFANNFISIGLHNCIKKNLINSLEFKKNSKILDLCCGTGDISRLIIKKEPSCEVIGVDFSQNMLEIAKNKTKNTVQFIKADITNLPFEDASFDTCIISFGLRNIQNQQKALAEISRVLKNKGTFVHLDFGKTNKFSNFCFKITVFLLIILTFSDKNSYFYLLNSKEKFPTPEKLINFFNFYKLKLKKRKDYIFKISSAQICEKII